MSGCLADGEVSRYLTEVVEPGDVVELRGPVGGWFVWRPTDPGPVLLAARRETGGAAAFRTVYSVRSVADRFYVDEPGVEIVEAAADLPVDLGHDPALFAGMTWRGLCPSL